jgi:hypothetical protein
LRSRLFCSSETADEPAPPLVDIHASHALPAIKFRRFVQLKFRNVKDGAANVR